MESNITIETFQLHGDLSHRQQLLDGLEQQTWPGQDSEKIYLIRKLEVSGPWWSIGSSAAEQARILASEAVSMHSNNIESAHAIYFESQAHLIAYLCRDIVNGNSDRWFWQTYPEIHLTHPVLHLLSDNILHLPKIVTILENLNEITRVFSSLNEKNIEYLLYRIASTTGWEIYLSEKNLKMVEYLQDDILNNLEFKKNIVQWQTLIKFAPTDNTSALLHLVSIILSWRFSPSILHNSAALAQWRFNIEKILSKPEKKYTEKTAQDESSIKVNIEERLTSIKNTNKILPLNHASNNNTNKKTDAKENKKSEENVFFLPRKNDQSINPFITEHEFITQYAGIFYLLNVFTQMQTIEEFIHKKVSLWQGIYRLVLFLNIDLDDTSRHFFVKQLHLKKISELNKLPQLPQEKALFTKIDRRYQHHAFWPESLIQIPGLVKETASHLDIYFHMTSLRLDVRIAGLDINPGWMPYLGRVITFHYGQDPQLKIEHDE